MILAAAAVGHFDTVKSQERGGRANLLLITIDTLRADRLGAYGYSRAQTPVLDALAREGAVFERAFTSAPLTLPAHCSILTGTYPTYHGVRDNSGFVLPENQWTLAEVLGSGGYRTGAFVGAFVLDSKFGLKQGFETYYDDFDLSKYENVSPGYIQRTGDEVVRRATSWIDGVAAQSPSKPFFAWVHLYDPHDPYTPPEPYRSRHPGRPYDGEIEFTDANVGALLAHLKSKGLYANTLVAVVGDHGESLGEHGESKHGFFIYNSTLHVPMIVRLPGGREAGRRITEHVSVIDLMPTLLQVLGVPAPKEAQGRGLLSLIRGRPASSRPEIYAECYYPRLQFGWSELRALITERHKYLLAPQPELYDLREDFPESRNLAAEQSGHGNQLREKLRTTIRRVSPNSTVASRKTNLDPETQEKLRSLGYVSLHMGDTGIEERSSLRDPKDEIGTYNELTSLFEKNAQKEFAEVIPRYERILQRQPGLKLVLYKLGQAYFYSGDYPSAAASYRRAIELGGDAALATFDLAQTYLRMKRTEDAAVGFRRTIELDPSHYRARANLGVLLREQGKLDEAIRQLEEAVGLVPRAVIALSNLGISYSLAGRHAEAEKTMRRAVEVSPTDGILRANLAAVLQRMGKSEEARREMETARKLDPRIRRP